MQEGVSHITGTQFSHEVDDITAGCDAVIKPDVFDRVDFERWVHIITANWRVIPQFPPALAGLLWLEPLLLKIG